ncbi:hypothetical protein MUY27_02490 [Mucilaginibacter sp. RS28]|uniref:Uncharacterized protein n=1 Tax=Mucilaginibacter straminoryzae TaxID=2932774 RepID=A0A9X2B8B8_9SPHI|nr:hypothetical protein [Mucilaginibacter straminoryzae]MCJ8208560.1 hypothetical protein [Mucilaginibacter straminoryzae]
MKLNFLESGIDSLKKGFENLTAYENLQFNNDLIRKKKQRYYHLKDAILFIQHGVEILFKQIIVKHSEYLLFTSIDENVKKAFREKKEKNLKSIFESEVKHKIHTVSFTESIERIKILPQIHFGKQFEEKVRALETYRNVIMHSEPYLDESKINQTFDGLANMLDVFFYQNLGKAYRTISGYGDFVRSFENFQNALKKNNQHLKAEALRVFMDAFNASELSMGAKELKRFTDVDCCAKFMDVLFDSSLIFGIDIYNGYCAGRTVIRRENKEMFKIIAEDKLFFCEFKFKSLIVYLPDMANQSSPIIFVECDSFIERDSKFKNAVAPDFHNILHVDYYRLNDGSILTGEDQMEAFHESESCVEYESVIRFYSSGILCLMNVQGLEYNYGLKRLIEVNRFIDGKDFEVGIRDHLDNF